MYFAVDTNGNPYAMRVAQASDPAFGTAAEECLRQWRFLPTLRDRQPVSTQVEMLIQFQIAATDSAPPHP
jgi:TonB family protein